ncbi:MAG: hypothetical protein PHF21_01585 [Bacilli bacterium]|nr:hypothetical protein [Bacilli bacterium]
MKNIKKYLILLFIVTITGVFLSLTMTLAKYVKDIAWEYHLKSQEFYFSSSELDSKIKENIINDWNQEKIFFTINNSKNEHLITKYDIDYEVSCRIIGEAGLHAKCNLNETNESIANGVLTSYQSCINNKEDEVDVSNYNKKECELEDYEWKDQVALSTLSFEIELTDPEYVLDEVEVFIEVISTSPYKKTLKGRYILHKKENPTLEVKFNNFEHYGHYIISNFLDVEKCLNLKWDTNDLIIEENVDLYDSYIVDNNNYINEIDISLGSNSSTSLTFYKKELTAITLKDFILNDCQN